MMSNKVIPFLVGVVLAYKPINILIHLTYIALIVVAYFVGHHNG